MPDDLQTFPRAGLDCDHQPRSDLVPQVPIWEECRGSKCTNPEKSAPRSLGLRRPLLTCVIEVPGPLVVVSLLREHRLGHELLSLVIQAVMQVIPKQEVQKGSLTISIVPEGGCPEPGMQEALRRKGKGMSNP